MRFILTDYWRGRSMGQRAPGGQTGRRWANLHSKPPRRLEEGKAMKTTAAIVSIALSLLSPAHA